MKNNLTLFSGAIIIATFVFSILFFVDAKAQTQTIKPVYERLYSDVGGFYESLPVDYNANSEKKYPLLIFMHGSGEKGDGSSLQLPKVLRNGPPRLLSQGKFPSKFVVNGQEFSFIVMAPQVESTTGGATAIKAMIEYCLKNYRVDEQRIYITGLSLGGLRCYNYTAYKKEITDKVAAMLLVCPNAYSLEERAKVIASSNLPVWLTNNDGDPLARIGNAIKTVDMINAYNPTPKAKITIFNKDGHDAWTQSYDPGFEENGQNVYEWMLSYTTPRTAVDPPPVIVAAPPVANAGADKIITLPVDSARLDGSASTTGTATIKTYQWSYTNGPASSIILSASQKSTIVKNLVAGTYTFTLTVTDSNGNSDLDSASVIVKPAPEQPAPAQYFVANAGADQIITLPTTATTLNASASSAGANRTIAAYLWKKLSGPFRKGDIETDNTAITVVKDFVPGLYAYQLTVTDDIGNIKMDTMSITVYYKNGVLKADAGSDTTLILPQSYMPLDGSNSTAPAGSNVDCAWKRISGTGSSSAVMYPSSNLVTTAGRPAPGTYVYQLMLRDDKGNRDSDYVTIIVKDIEEEATPEVKYLTANAGADQAIALPETQTVLDGSGSFPGTSYTIDSYLWKKLEGPFRKGDIDIDNTLAITVKDLVPGLYTYQLTVTDNAGNTETDTVNITVYYKNGALKADAGGDTTLILPQSYMPLDGSNSTAPANSNVGCAWKRISGPGSSSAVMYPSSNLVTTAGRPAPGTYVYQLTLRDDKGNRDSDYVTIIVRSEPEISGRTTEANSHDKTIGSKKSGINSKALSLSVKPNPVTSSMQVQIDGAAGNGFIQVYDMQGRMMQYKVFSKQSTGVMNVNMEVDRLGEGAYVLQVIINGNLKKATRFIKL